MEQSTERRSAVQRRRMRVFRRCADSLFVNESEKLESGKDWEELLKDKVMER